MYWPNGGHVLATTAEQESRDQQLGCRLGLNSLRVQLLDFTARSKLRRVLFLALSMTLFVCL